MEVHLSQNEVITKSTQALRALNIPSGLDIENGKNIAWLATRGLPGLQILYEEIKTSSDITCRSPLEINIVENIVRLSSWNHSAFCLAQSAVDFAEIGKNVSVKKCRFPLLIFAEMARREHLPFGFKVQWVQEGQITRGFSISGNSEITLNSTCLNKAYDLNITLIRELKIKHPLKVFDQDKVFKDVRILVDAAQWETICAQAKNVLVPDSKQSRSAAGADVDDSS